MRSEAIRVLILAVGLFAYTVRVAPAAGQGKSSPESEALAGPYHPATFLQSRWLMQVEVSGTADWALAKGPERSRRFRLLCTYIRDGERLDVQTVRYDDGKPVRGWRSIVDGTYISFAAPPSGKTALKGFYATDGNRFIGACIPNGWSGFEGYAGDDYISLREILATASQLKTGKEVVDGWECTLLAADSPTYGHYQAWLDGQADYLPRKLQVEKRPGNRLGDRTFAKWDRLVPPGSRGPVALIAVDYLMDQARFEKVQDRWFPLSCRVTTVERFADGNAETTVMSSRRTRLELDPDLAALHAFEPTLRGGAPLANLVNPQLVYQWKDGAAVPLVNPTIVAQMDQTAAAIRQAQSRAGGGEGR